MTTDYHTPWQDGVTDFNETDMNGPLGELDEQIGINKDNIDTHTHNLAYSYGPYDIGGTLDGKPAAAGVILRYPLPRSIHFVAGMEKSQMVSSVAADAESVFSLKKNDVEFATATFAAAASTATFICGTTTSFIKSDVLTLVSPNPQDADLEDIGWALAAVRLAEVTTTTTTTTTSTTTTSSTISTSSSTTTSTSTTTSSTTSTVPI